jgi:hypothetical protein
MLLSGGTMVALQRAALLFSALAGIVAAASDARADSINLLRLGSTATSPFVLILASKRPFETDEEVRTLLDEQCVAVRAAHTASSRLGNVQWRFGQLAWQWNPAGEPNLIYVLCGDRRHHASALGGDAMPMFAGLWSGLPSGNRRGDAGAVTGAFSIEPGAPEAPIDPTPLPGWNTGEDPPISRDIGSDTPPPAGAGDSLAPTSANLFAIGSGSAIGDAPVAPIDWPITLDPSGAPLVPEPGTWLLFGSGLAAAWRTARRRQ